MDQWQRRGYCGPGGFDPRDFDLDSEALDVGWVLNFPQVTGAEYERRY